VIESHTSFHGYGSAWLVCEVTICISLIIRELGLFGFYDKQIQILDVIATPDGSSLTELTKFALCVAKVVLTLGL
jgi:hypothetical protein